MVFANKYAGLFLNKFTKFKNSDSLRDAIELYSVDNMPNNISAMFSGLTIYVTNEIIKNNPNITQEEIEIFQYIESSLAKFDKYPDGSDESDFDNAACVCFLENLLNYASAERIKYSRFIPLLGERSRTFCKSWDEFSGVRSPGLWSDAEWGEIQKK